MDKILHHLRNPGMIRLPCKYQTFWFQTLWLHGCGSKIGPQIGTLVTGNQGLKPVVFRCSILPHSHMGCHMPRVPSPFRGAWRCAGPCAAAARLAPRLSAGPWRGSAAAEATAPWRSCPPAADAASCWPRGSQVASHLPPPPSPHLPTSPHLPPPPPPLSQGEAI